jgi:hypothetical protein
MNTTIMPIVVSGPKPTLCPNCKKDESKNEVCNHCGYVYQQYSPTPLEFCIVVSVIVFVIWVFVTIFYWLMNASYQQLTLVDVIVSQLDFVCSLRVW